ncbi:hypothetical protein [[Ruminococcus] lactaris]|uniref:hypothetical protein n=1 Tax=[Ruminococcus] lactaris TaxID=46228 RepID=UPI00307966B7
MLMYPKKAPGKKRRIKHPPSILQADRTGECYLCEKFGIIRYWTYLEEHHIFDGNPGRRISEENGFKVKLCAGHHRISEKAVHKDIVMMRILQQDAQRAYERTHTREQWMELMGRNYIDNKRSIE